MTQTKYESKTIVLKKTIDETNAFAMVEEKKTSLFKKLLKTPKREEVHIHSFNLYYECILMVSGKYAADYYRNTTHTISVDSNVREVIIGDGLFPIRSKSILEKTFVGKRGKNKITLQLDEHVFVEEEDVLIFDHHGREIKFPFKINSKTIENYPQRVLEKNSPNIKKPEITHDAAIKKLKEFLKKPIDSEIRELNEEFILREITLVYVPIFEARLIGPKKKICIMRIDAVRKKIL